MGERIRNQEVIRRVRKGDFKGEIFLVGGAVREIALGASPKDYDFVVDNDEDMERFESLFLRKSFVLGKKPIQTRRLVAGEISLDINRYHGTIGDDLRRRDFTINAIAYDLKRDIILDPMNGLSDLEARTIRCPGVQVIKDDPLRMLKAVRHFVTLDGFGLDRELLRILGECRHLIHEAAPERIKHELDQIIPSPRAFEGIRVMEETGLLFELFPGLDALRSMDREKGFVLETYGHTVDGFKYLPRYSGLYGLDESALRNTGYALLFHDLGKAFTFSYDEKKNLVHFFYHEKHSREMAASIMESMRFSGAEIKTILALIESHMRIFLISGADSTEKAVRRLVYKMEGLCPLLIVHSLCDMFGSSGGTENPSTRRVEAKCQEVLRMYYEWRREPLPRLINGDDLLALGFGPGPLLGMILAEIREKQISGEIRGKEEALRHASTYLSQRKS